MRRLSKVELPADLLLSRTDHLYPAQNWLTQKDQGWMQYYSKNFYIGEMDWTGTVRVSGLALSPNCD